MKRSRTAAVALGAIAIASIGFVGCGGSDTASTTAAATSTMADGANAEPRMTEAAYRAAADKICSDADAQTKAIPDPSDPADVGTTLAASGVVIQDSVDAFSGLYPPASLEAAHQRLVAALQKSADVFTTVASEAKTATSADEVAALVSKIETPENTQLTADVDAAAKELGLPSCGSNDSGGTTTS